MRFSLYSEIQLHPGRSPEQLYDEVLEQMVNADRLGYDVYAVIEHFFFPKFSISANPTALFAAAAQRTKRLRFRTMLHALPYHNPTVLASAIAVTDILTGGRYEFGVGRGHGWIPPKAGVPLDEHARPSYEEAVDLLFGHRSGCVSHSTGWVSHSYAGRFASPKCSAVSRAFRRHRSFPSSTRS